MLTIVVNNPDLISQRIAASTPFTSEMKPSTMTPNDDPPAALAIPKKASKIAGASVMTISPTVCSASTISSISKAGATNWGSSSTMPCSRRAVETPKT